MNLNSRFTTAAMALTLIASASPVISAQEKTPAAEDPYLTLAVARTKVEIVIRDVGPITDTSRNGFDAAWQATDQAFTRAIETLNKVRDAEGRKEETARNQQLIDNCNEKMEALNKDWQTFNQKDRQELREKLQDAVTDFSNLTQAFNGQVSQEQSLKTAKMDLGALTTMFASMEKKLQESRARIQAAVEKTRQSQQKWEKSLAAAEAFVTKAGYPVEKPAADKAQ